MSGVDVSIDDLRAAGRRIGEVADVVRSADVSGDVVAVAHALPGSLSADAARDLGRVWSSRVRKVAGTAATHEQRFADSADAYVASDQRAAQEFRTLQSALNGGNSSGLAAVSGLNSEPNPTCPASPER